MIEETIVNCPALHSRSKHYPERFCGKVPKSVRVLKRVTPDAPLCFLTENRTLVAEEGRVYNAWTNSHGAVSAVLDDGRRLGLKPDEFEIVTWHDSTNAD